jgi:hypothetical protein
VINTEIQEGMFMTWMFFIPIYQQKCGALLWKTTCHRWCSTLSDVSIPFSNKLSIRWGRLSWNRIVLFPLILTYIGRVKKDSKTTMVYLHSWWKENRRNTVNLQSHCPNACEEQWLSPHYKKDTMDQNKYWYRNSCGLQLNNGTL